VVGGDPAGGSIEVARLIDEYGDTLVPDLLEFYGVDIRHLFVDGSGVTPRFVLDLIIHLPSKSRTVAMRRGGEEFSGWTMERYLAVGTYNTLQQLLYSFVRANSDPKKHKPRPPEMIPTPVDKSKQKTTHKPGSFAGIALAALNRKKRKG